MNNTNPTEQLTADQAEVLRLVATAGHVGCVLCERPYAASADALLARGLIRKTGSVLIGSMGFVESRPIYALAAEPVNNPKPPLPIVLSPSSMKLFRGLARAAGDWDGSPLFEGTKAECGNLTDLKRAGLVETVEEDDGNVFVTFTERGHRFASLHGLRIQGLNP